MILPEVPIHHLVPAQSVRLVHVFALLVTLLDSHLITQTHKQPLRNENRRFPTACARLKTYPSSRSSSLYSSPYLRLISLSDRRADCVGRVDGCASGSLSLDSWSHRVNVSVELGQKGNCVLGARVNVYRKKSNQCHVCHNIQYA